MKIVTLVLSDHQAVLKGHEGDIVIDNVDKTLKLTHLEILINLTDLDVHVETLPPMSFLDRRQYLKQLQKQQQAGLLQGYRLIGTQLVHFSCPMTDYIKQWLERILPEVRIRRIRPYFIRPDGSPPYSLVIDQNRHTLFQSTLPIFTRYVPQFSVTEVLETYKYVRQHYAIDSLPIQCYLPNVEMTALQEILPQAQFLEKITHCTDFEFQPPTFVKAANQDRMIKNGTLAAAALSIGFLGSGGWQYFDYSRLQRSLNEQHQQLETLQEQLQHHKANLPLDKLLPQSYRDRQEEPSPIDLFHRIHEVMSHDIHLSALKWENMPQEVRLSLQAVIPADDAEAMTESVKEFKLSLEEALPDFTAEIQAYPHGSGDHETFSGTTSDKDLTLSGDGQKATILLARKKP